MFYIVMQTTPVSF